MLEGCGISIMYQKVINYQHEYGTIGVVSEEAWGSACFFVPGLLEVWYEVVASNPAGLWEAVHAFVNLCIYPSIYHKVV